MPEQQTDMYTRNLPVLVPPKPAFGSLMFNTMKDISIVIGVYCRNYVCQEFWHYIYKCV